MGNQAIGLHSLPTLPKTASLIPKRMVAHSALWQSHAVSSWLRPLNAPRPAGPCPAGPCRALSSSQVLASALVVETVRPAERPQIDDQHLSASLDAELEVYALPDVSAVSEQRPQLLCTMHTKRRELDWSWRACRAWGGKQCDSCSLCSNSH